MEGRVGESEDESTDLNITTAAIPSHFLPRHHSHRSRFLFLAAGIYTHIHKYAFG